MTRLFFDASALVKRYAAEPGTSLVNRIFATAPAERMMCLMLGAGEALAALVRQHNSGVLTTLALQEAEDALNREVVACPEFRTLSFMNADVVAAFPLLKRHNINITDAVLLELLTSIHALMRSSGDDVVLIASDLRLLRAARAEGIPSFDPERQSQAELDALLSPEP